MPDSAPIAATSDRESASRWRPPWWLIIGAAAFLVYFHLLVHTDLRRPEPPGFSFRFVGTEMRVETVAVGSPADLAGLQSGDRIAAAGGRPIRGRLDWVSFEANMQRPWTMALELVRVGREIPATIRLETTTADFWLTTPGITLVVTRLTQFATLILAIVVALKRPFDGIARVGSWLLASVAVYSVDVQFGIASGWRSLPLPLAALMWLPHASSLLIAPIVFTFFTLLPRPLLQSRWTWLAAWAPALTLLPLQLLHTRTLIYSPGQPAGSPWTNAVTAIAVGYVVASVIAAAIGYRREEDVTNRRRVRVLAIGSIAGLSASLPVVIGYWRSGALLSSTVFGSTAAALGMTFGLALPATFAYAILTQRLFGISFIVRRTLQYALARRVLLSGPPVAAALFLIDLWFNRQMTVADVLRARGWIYGTLAALAVVAHARRHAWLHQLDRRFFREHYDAQRVLRSIGDDVREAPVLSASAPRMVARIDEALHPALAALLVREPGDQFYRPIATAPSGADVDPLRSDSAIPGLLAVLRHPFRANPSAYESVLRQLPATDFDWLTRHRIELLVPSRFGADGTEAFFVFGAKRSEEPYSSEEEDMLMTIGHGIALLLPRPSEGGFEECPTCGSCYELGAAQCARDGAALARQGLPRVLANRFRLERRIGRGGMGTVYSARDSALDRRVAVKLLREDLGEPVSAERFRSEARIAATLSHPNIVAVHDIGVTAGGRAFFVMELLDGETLEDVLRRDGPLRSDRALRILRGVGAAVKAAHARQLIHRDLKPANIFLCRGESGEVAKVLDFGLAKALETSGVAAPTHPGLVAGTPRYMAPEHLRGEDASPDWDLWALAVIALEMLAGPGAVDRPAGASVAVNRLSPALRQAFAAALSAEPLDRPASVDELLQGLERGLHDHEQSA